MKRVPYDLKKTNYVHMKKLFRNLAMSVIMILTALSVNAMDINAQKEVLKRIWICQTIMSELYTAPAEYIVDTSSNNLTGQLFYAFNEGQYNQLDVNFSKINSIKATFQDGFYRNPHKIQLQFDKEELVSIKEEFREGIYKIKKEGNGNYVVNKEFTLNGKLITERSTVEMNEDKIIKIENYKMNKNKEFHFSTITFTYSDGQVIYNRVYHANAMGNKKHNIQPFNCLYKIKSENNVYKENNYYGSNEYTYNQDGYTIERISQDKGKTVKYNYEYINNALFKTISVTTENGIQKEKEIRIEKEQPNADRSSPEYEWKEGIYRFDENGILVYEIHGGMYRKKINGIWSEWQHMSY
jgi:hypothetical protein